MFWAVVAAIAGVFAAAGGAIAVWYAWRGEKRTTDRGDVFWRIFRESPDTLQVWNAGQDPAHDVRLVLVVAEHPSAATANVVLPNTGISVVCSIAETLHTRWVERRKRIGAIAPNMQFPTETMEVRLHITWRSKSGRWATQETVERMSSALL